MEGSTKPNIHGLKQYTTMKHEGKRKLIEFLSQGIEERDIEIVNHVMNMDEASVAFSVYVMLTTGDRSTTIISLTS